MPSNPAPPQGPESPTPDISEQTRAFGQLSDQQKKAIEQTKKFGQAVIEAGGDLLTLENIGKGAFGALEIAATQLADKTIIDNAKAKLDAFADLKINSATRQISEMILDTTGMNALAIEKTQFGVNNMAKQMSDALFKLTNESATAATKLLDGTAMNMQEILGLPRDLVAAYQQAAIDDTRLANAAIKGMNYDVVESAALASKSLRLTQSETSELFQRELSATGKVSGEVLKEFEKTVLAVSQVTGDMPTRVAQDLAKMEADFNHFGAMTLPEMGKLSAQMHQLGLDISDVTRIADQFSTFDKATQTASNFAAVIGATLDPLELFRQSVENPGELIETLRNSLEEQGIEFENLNIMQQKTLASSLGLDPVMFQRLLNDNIENIGDITADVSSKVSGMTDEERRTALVDMGNLVAEAKKLGATDIANQQAALANASAEYAKTIEQSFRSTVLVTDNAVKAADGARQSALDAMNKVKTALDSVNAETVRVFGGTPTNVPQPQAPSTTPPGPAASPAPPAQSTTPSASIPAPAAPAAASAAPPAATEAPTATSTAPATAPAATAAAPVSPTVAYIPTTAATLTEAQREGTTGTDEAHTLVSLPQSKPAEAQKKQESEKPAPPAPPPQSINITLTFTGGDDFGRAIASSVVAAATSAEGVPVGGVSVKLATVGPTDSATK